MKKTQDPFNQKKAHILRQIESTPEEYSDRSPKGSIDVPLIPLIKLINDQADLVTTSSCSGRVSVYLEGQKDHSRPGSKGLGGKWLFITHDVKDLDSDWWTAVKSGKINQSSPDDSGNRYLLYKFEPVILHVKCRDLETAQKLYKCAMDCGYRESGIGSNNLVGIRTSMGLDVPIAQVAPGSDNLVPLVTDQYISLLDNMAVELFQKNADKIDHLHARLQSTFS